MPDRAPISPQGWQIHEHFYEGGEQVLLYKSLSLGYLRKFKAGWEGSEMFNLGHSELVISPVDGLESIQADPFGAIAWAIQQGLVSI